MESKRTESGLIREYLHDQTIGCPVCRYNLRGALGDSCPECGTKLELRISSVDLKLAPWLIQLLAMALPLGFVGTLALAGCFGAWRSVFWSPNDSWVLGAIWTAAVIEALGILLIIRRRSRFLQRPRAEQWARAIGVAAIMAGLQVLSLYLFSMHSR